MKTKYLTIDDYPSAAHVEFAKADACQHTEYSQKAAKVHTHIAVAITESTLSAFSTLFETSQGEGHFANFKPPPMSDTRARLLAVHTFLPFVHLGGVEEKLGAFFHKWREEVKGSEKAPLPENLEAIRGFLEQAVLLERWFIEIRGYINQHKKG